MSDRRLVYGVYASGDEEKEKTMGFAPDRCQRTEYPVSRDWKVIDCSAKACIYNRDEHYTVPSLAEIGDDGRCKGFKVK